MASIVTISATYQGDPDAIFAEALRFGELAEAMSGFARYDGLPLDAVAEEGATYRVDVTLWGVIKNPGHVMHVERLDRAARIVQSREHNPSVKRWDHELSVQPEGDHVLWRDRVVIDAGWRSWATARFAAYVYTRRHRARKALSVTRAIELAPPSLSATP